MLIILLRNNINTSVRSRHYQYTSDTLLTPPFSIKRVCNFSLFLCTIANTLNKKLGTSVLWNRLGNSLQILFLKIRLQSLQHLFVPQVKEYFTAKSYHIDSVLPLKIYLINNARIT